MKAGSVSDWMDVTIVGAGRFASFLAGALCQAGFGVSEIIVRAGSPSRRRAHALAARVGAQCATLEAAELEAAVLWICVPDRDIQNAASSLADAIAIRGKNQVRFAFHSSGALLSRELVTLRKLGIATASVHPLMTFVAKASPSLRGVPFALEGDSGAVRTARQIVGALGGESWILAAKRKAAYHAWATMTSPLLVAFLATLEEAARATGLTAKQARRNSLPILMQTLANYSRLGAAGAFSGPLIRGDADTVAKHLDVLKKNSRVRGVYIALAREALRKLPVKNRDRLAALLQTADKRLDTRSLKRQKTRFG